MGKISDALERYRQERKLQRVAASQAPELRPEDWNVLMGYNKKTGRLDLHNRKIIKDPGTIHRLLANRLISPDGKLSSTAKRQCEERRKQVREALAGGERGNQMAKLMTSAEEKQTDSQEDGREFEKVETQEYEAAVQLENLNETDLTILMGYDRNSGHLLTYDEKTGELDNQSLEIMRDRGVLKRLLSAEMIYPGGKLTPAAINLCAELTQRHKNGIVNDSILQDPIDDIDQFDDSASPAAELVESDWDALFEYDRDTGNLIKYDSETGQLDERSRAILRDPDAIQRLIDNKMILPGGWLTREAKQICENRVTDHQQVAEKQNIAASEPSQSENKIIAPEAPEISAQEQTRPLVEGPKIIAPHEVTTEHHVISEVGPEPEMKAIKSFRKFFESNAIDDNLVCLLDPLSYEAEQFKMLRTNILFPVSGQAPRSILVTSTMPGEGKSFVVSNLAVAIAQDIDRHVLIVDCDMRRPKIHTQFGFGEVPGLSDYLANRATLQDLFLNTRVDKLSILPAGKTPPNPAELLSSEKMSALLEEITERYKDRMIIIDSPPPKLTAESSFLARKVDGIILVVNYGKTRREDAKDLVGKLGKEKILGCVINRFDRHALGYYGYIKDRKYGHYYSINK